MTEKAQGAGARSRSEAVRSVERAAALMAAIAATGRQGACLTDLAAASTLSKTTAHRLLNTLVNLGWVSHDPERTTFHIGARIAEMGIIAVERNGLSRVAARHLANLATLTDDSIYLTVRDGDRLVCIDRARGTVPLQAITMSMGSSRQMGSCAGSIALLTGMSDSALSDYIAGISPALNNEAAEAIRNSVTTARLRGYATSPGPARAGIDGIGVPVHSPDGTVIAALSVEAPSTRLNEPRRTHVAKLLQQEAQSLTASLSRLPSYLSGVLQKENKESGSRGAV